MASWFTHNLQRRLLLYFIQKISLFSQIDIAALDVSLGSSSHFTFHDLDLDVDNIDLPDVTIRSGFLKKLDLNLTVSGGLSVAASGVAFVVKPNLSKAFDAQASSLLLTKTVFDLTSSVMHLDGGKDEFPDEDSILDDTSESSSTNQNSGSAAAPSMLQSMRNKALDLILSKLSMVLSDVSIKVLFSEENIVELRAGEIEFTSANETRQINISGLALNHLKQTRKGEEESTGTPKAEASMSESLLYSKAEATSIYMSAIQSMADVDQADTSTAGQKEGIALLTINNLNISFKGFTSIDDIAVRDAMVEFDRCRIELHHIAELSEPIIIPLIMLLINQPKKPTSVSTARTPQNLHGYKRFREEQDLHDENFFSSFGGNEIKIFLSDTLYVTIGVFSFSLSDHQLLHVKLDALSAYHNESIIFEVARTLERSIVEASYAIVEGNIEVKVNGNTNIDIEIDSARELLKCFFFLRKSFEIWQQNVPRSFKKKGKSGNQVTLKVEGKPLNLRLHLATGTLKLSTTDCLINLPSALFACDAIKLEMQHSNTSVDLISISNVDVKCHSDPSQHSSFNHGFDEVILSTKCKAFVKKVKLYATAEVFKRILSEIQDIQSELSLLSPDFGVVKSSLKSPRHLKRSVRVMGSSSFINKQSSTVHCLIEIDLIDGLFEGFLHQAFGDLSITGKGCFMYYNEDNTFTGYVKTFDAERTLDGKSEVLISCACQHKSQAPVVTFHKKLSGKLSCAFRKVGIHYHARWLDFLQGKQETAPSTPSTRVAFKSVDEQSGLEIRLIECAIHLNPYRLKAQMLLVVGKCAMELSMPAMNLKGSIRAGSLLLIDDIANFKPRPSSQEVTYLSPYYTDRGFANIGKFDKFHFSTWQTCEGLKAMVDMGTLSLSLCADSMQTCTQVSVDLGIPVSFPEVEKYRTKPPQVEVFHDVDEQFFTGQKLQLDPSVKQDGNSSTADILSKAYFDEAVEFGDFQVLGRAASSSDEPVLISGAQDSYFDNRSQQTESNTSNSTTQKKLALTLSLERAIIKLYDGFDWAYTRNSVSDLINRVETALEHQDSARQETVKASVFDSIFLFAGAEVSPGSLRQQINNDLQTEPSIVVGSPKKLRLRPSSNYKIRIEASGLKINVLRYNVDEPTESTSDLSADILNDITLTSENVEVIDNIPTSTWNKLATHWKHEPRAKGSDMFFVNIMTVKPLDFLAATELILKIKVLPLRLHIDQDALDFLTRFFEFKDARFELIDEFPDFVYIQKLEVESVKIKMDYKPKSVDYSVLKSGHKSEFMNFFILEGSELQLRHLIVYGVNGFPELNKILNGIWVPDITGSQLKGILGGVAPMKTVVTLGTGIKALVSTPVKEYKRDQNLSRGLQKGTQVFIKITASEFIRLGVKLTSGTQALLENMEEVMGGEGSQARNHKLKGVDLEIISEDVFKKYERLVGGRNPKPSSQEPEALFVEPGAREGDAPRVFSLYADQPSSLRQGLKEAQGSFGRNVTLAYEAVLKAQHDIKDNASAHETASTLARVVPVALLRPIIGATEALSKALQGVSNELDEEQMAMLKDKYKSRN